MKYVKGIIFIMVWSMKNLNFKMILEETRKIAG